MYEKYEMEVVLLEQSDVMTDWSNQGHIVGPDSVDDKSDM